MEVCIRCYSILMEHLFNEFKSPGYCEFYYSIKYQCPRIILEPQYMLSKNVSQWCLQKKNYFSIYGFNNWNLDIQLFLFFGTSLLWVSYWYHNDVTCRSINNIGVLYHHWDKLILLHQQKWMLVYKYAIQGCFITMLYIKKNSFVSPWYKLLKVSIFHLSLGLLWAD